MTAQVYDRPITIQSCTVTKDAAGAVVKTWSNYATDMARYKPVGGMEYFAAAQNNSRIDAKLYIRYRSGITSEMRVLFNDLTWEIIAPPMEVGRRTELEIKVAAIRQS